MKYTVCLVLALIVAGCSTDKDQLPEPQSENLVKVDGTYITREDVDYHLGQFSGLALVDAEAVEERVVESLVLSRLMARQQLSQMSEQDKQKLEVAVRAYREELLVKAYAEQHLNRIVPEQKDIEAYYRKHQSRFGGGVYYDVSVIQFEKDCLIGTEALIAENKKSVEPHLENIKCQRNKHQEKVGQESLMAVSGQFETPEAGQVFWKTEKTGAVLRIIENSETRSPRPLTEVAHEIRKALAPKYMKQAMASEKEKLLSNMEVEYID